MLSYSRLNQQSKYLELKSLLTQHYIERTKPLSQQTMHVGMDLSWKDHLYKSLLALLLELQNTVDSSKQEKLLSVVYNWYLEKARLRSRSTKLIHPISSTKAHSATPIRAELRSFNTPQPKQSPNFITNLENRLLFARKRDIAHSKLAEIQHTALHEWTRSKSKEREEQLRKFEQRRVFSSRSLPKPTEGSMTSVKVYKDFRYQQESDSDSETESISKIAILRKKHRQLIDIESSPRAIPKKFQASISSTFIRNIRSEQVLPRKANIADVLAVKARLAARKIACRVEQIEDGLVLPDAPSPPLLKPSLFPRSGENLLQYPTRPRITRRRR